MMHTKNRHVSSNRIKIMKEIHEADKYDRYLKNQNHQIEHPASKKESAASSSSDSLIPVEESSSSVSSENVSIASSASTKPSSNSIVSVSDVFKPLHVDRHPKRQQHKYISSHESITYHDDDDDDGFMKAMKPDKAHQQQEENDGRQAAYHDRIDRGLHQHLDHVARQKMPKHDHTHRAETKAHHSVNKTMNAMSHSSYWSKRIFKHNRVVNACTITAIFFAAVSSMLFVKVTTAGADASAVLQRIAINVLILAVIFTIVCLVMAAEYTHKIDYDKSMKRYVERRHFGKD